eukprot:1560642-Alexandrium_andersonii.AAC.1
MSACLLACLPACLHPCTSACHHRRLVDSLACSLADSLAARQLGVAGYAACVAARCPSGCLPGLPTAL